MSKINIDKKILTYALLASLIVSVLFGWIIFENTSHIDYSDLPLFYDLEFEKMYMPLEMIFGLVAFIFLVLTPILYMAFWHVKNDKRFLFYVVFPNGFVLTLLTIDGITNIGIFKNSILVIILMTLIFLISVLYYIKIWRQRLVEKMVKKLSDLKAPIEIAKTFGIGLMIVSFLFSGFIVLVWLAALIIPQESVSYGPYPLMAFAFVMIFYAFIWFFFTGLMFYEQTKILSDKKYAENDSSLEFD